MKVAIAVLLYLCLGMGVSRIKIANNKRIRGKWDRLNPAGKLLVVASEPLMTVVRGWEGIFLSLYAGVTGNTLEFEPEDDEEDTP